MQQLLFYTICLVTLFSKVSAKELRVAYSEAPPYVYQVGAEIKGVNVRIWEEIAKKENLLFSYHSFRNEKEMLSALATDCVDVVINPLKVTTDKLAKFPLSTPTYVSSIGAMTRNNFHHSSWFKAVLSLMSVDFFKVIVIIGGVIFLFGLLMWLAEKNKNSLHFDRSRKGLIDSFWWSAVTMTTVGYGDKYPVTVSGKMIALIWMFMAMVIISSLTAGISSVLTVSNLSTGIANVDDLGGLHVGTIKNSSSSEYLSYHLRAYEFEELDSAVNELKEGNLDVVVYDAPQMQHYINKNMQQKELEISPIQLRKEILCFAFSPNFSISNVINYHIAAVTESPMYDLILAKEGLEK